MNCKKIIFLFGLAMILISCQETIQLDAPEGESRIVVEAWLDDQLQEQTIRITETLPYFQNEFAPGLTGANVVINSSSGKVLNFTDQGNGDYTYDATSESIGSVGDIFNLQIDVKGKSISSSSTLNPVPPIDSIVQEYRDDSFGEGIYCNFFSRDLLGLGDVYWIKTYQNDQFLARPLEINLAFDAGFAAGSEVDNLIFIPPIREAMNPIQDSLGTSPWKVGDKCRVEIHSLNLDGFFFMEAVRTQLQNSLNTIFAEPITNSKGNLVNNSDDEEILGIFNVASISALEVVIE